MQYKEFKNNFINKVYVPYLNGDMANARLALANIYQKGSHNPRATLYQLTSSIKDCNKILKNDINNLKANGQKNLAGQIMTQHVKFSSEIFGAKHPIIKTALENLKTNLKEIYPSKKTRKISQFVMFKELYPILEKLKCLTRFFINQN